MRLIWVQDMDFMVLGGGAQLTDRAHYLEGVRRGHDIKIILPESISELEYSVEGVIISNASMFPVEVFQRYLDSGIPMIIFSHDYVPICKYRLFYPMQDGCKSCYLGERWLPILSEASLLIWLSPLHRESWMWLYPELAGVPYHLAPSPVDPTLFYNMEREREGVVAVESLAPFKGRDHVLRWAEGHPEVEVTFVGGGSYPEGSLPPNCKSIGYVPYSEMNKLYNQHEALLHLPQSPSPFDRTVAEAYMAGCKVIGNSLVGALSYPWFKSRQEVAEHCRSSSREFWEAIENVLR